MLVSKLLIFLVLYLCTKWTNGMTISAVVESDDTSILDYVSYMIDHFNEYAKTNGLDIELGLTAYSQTGDSIIDSLISKQSTKYDLFIFSDRNSANYVDSFLDLYSCLSLDHISMYNHNIISKSIINNKLIGLPMFLNNNILYANKEYLKKYAKSVPKTWDELIDTALYILEMEKGLGNSNLIGYNGLFTDDTVGAQSIYEFIYTFRDSIDDKFPDFSSSGAYNALTKLKSIKEMIASDNIFMSDGNATFGELAEGNLLFAKFINVGEMPHYYKAPLPGNKDGISGSYVSGKYVGIPNFISEERQKVAIEVLKYLTSYQMQKSLVIDYKGRIYSPIPRLYDDEDVCKDVDCNLMKNIQPIFMPIDVNNDVLEKKLVSSTYEYLYGDAPISQALGSMNYYMGKHINNLSLNKK